jgi:hypothetical protein
MIGGIGGWLKNKAKEKMFKKDRIKLQEAWEEYKRLYREGVQFNEMGNKRLIEGRVLLAEGKKSYAKSAKEFVEQSCDLSTEGFALLAEGNKSWSKGLLVFLNAVLEVYGDISIEWGYKDGPVAEVGGIKYK